MLVTQIKYFIHSFIHTQNCAVATTLWTYCDTNAVNIVQYVSYIKILPYTVPSYIFMLGSYC